MLFWNRLASRVGTAGRLLASVHAVPPPRLPAVGRLLRASYVSRTAVSAENSKSTADDGQLAFPCVDLLADRQRALDNGPEPAYDRVVTGYETYQHQGEFCLDHGGKLRDFRLAYETWGKLSADRTNAILLHTGLSASSHARSHEKNLAPGWWEKFIGPGRPLDTSKFFVICTNVLGGCYGSTGPSSVDPATGERYATRFPMITLFDMVRAQFELIDHLGIRRLHASVGASMGGMQSLAAAAMFPDRVGRLITISACARSHPYSIALRHTQRQVLMSDANWNKGHYYGRVPPHIGMKLAREIATITYRSGPEWEQRFGRKRADDTKDPAMCPDFLIETYLDHQGERFCLQYDANSWLYISKAMDMFDISESAQLCLAEKRRNTHGNNDLWAAQLSAHAKALEAIDDNIPTDLTSSADFAANERADLARGLGAVQMPTLVLGVQSDLLFPHWQQREVAESLRAAGNRTVTYYELDAIYGHDTFLIDVVTVGAAVKGHLENSIA
ncbi:Alpha/Beta hydrolase protein [Thamnocephalis sphaerospora]|uniref:Alpha/Beta hydrolase protein n=1 Tax=Thamnocephalis sphaerospora TaxID=78915 RepID=A0A4P9XR22_9FUNG|nr:Alpha/Beta hydrolase protein [Thamnocephalis sphaerospora]|eukprot:RKP08514.1 Alpha/Beta hydrolase protein [Thamnocephalis sphaerospora]